MIIGEVVLFLLANMKLALACTLKPRDVLKVKNFVEIHALRRGIQHLQF